MDISTYTKIIFTFCDSTLGANYTSTWRRGSTICGDFQRFFYGGDEQRASSKWREKDSLEIIPKDIQPAGNYKN
jgi:hypothetical protein